MFADDTHGQKAYLPETLFSPLYSHRRPIKRGICKTIRSTAGAGALALATTLLFGWSAGSALAAPAGQANASSNGSYPLSLRGNIGDYTFGSGDEECLLCSPDNTANCECVFIQSGTSTYWSWGTNPYSAVAYELELDYPTNNLTDSGTGGSCATAIGGFALKGPSRRTSWELKPLAHSARPRTAT